MQAAQGLLRYFPKYIPADKDEINIRTYVYGDVELVEIAVQLSKRYSNRMLPKIHEAGNLRQKLFRC